MLLPHTQLRRQGHAGLAGPRRAVRHDGEHLRRQRPHVRAGVIRRWRHRWRVEHACLGVCLLLCDHPPSVLTSLLQVPLRVCSRCLLPACVHFQWQASARRVAVRSHAAGAAVRAVTGAEESLHPPGQHGSIVTTDGLRELLEHPHRGRDWMPFKV